MAYDVSTVFEAECEKQFLSPLRKFFIGNSEYTERVSKWPTFKRYAQDFKIGTLNIVLANHDGDMNQFYEANYKFMTSAYLQYGFDYGGSTELITMFTGTFSRVKYTNNQAVITLKDKLYDFSNFVIGSTESPVDITSVLPSDMFWTLTTCYGQLDDTTSDNNVDIDYGYFENWADVFSQDDIFVSGNFQGEKISEALSSLARMTDSTIYAEGDGKIYVQRYSTVNTYATVIGDAHTIDVEMDVLQKNLINKQLVGFNYAVESDYWEDTVIAENAASQNSYGIYEDLLADETIWYVSSLAAFKIAERLVLRYKEPPKLWKPKSVLIGLPRQMGETIKFANDFYGQTSESGTRIVGLEFNSHEGTMKFTLDTSVQFDAFVLDVDSLDSTDKYLL